MMKRLGILVLSKPGGHDLETVCGICQAAGEMGAEVEVFLMGDGVYHLLDNRLEDAAKKGAKVSFCSLNARERDIDPDSPDLAGVEEGSQYTLACMVEESDRFLVFT